MALQYPERLFCAHEDNKLGVQALNILRGLGARTEVLKGGDPRAPQGAYLFLAFADEYKSSFLRLHPRVSKDRADARRAQTLQDILSWTLNTRVVFINPEHADAGVFKDKALSGFTMALRQLAGYTDPAIAQRRTLRRASWRQQRQREREPLHA